MKCTDEKNISLAVKGYKIFFSSTSLTSNGKPTSGLKINRKPVVGFNHKKRQLISGRGTVWLLLWTINKVDKLELPTQQVIINEIVSRLPEFLTDPKEFIETAIIRPTTEILDISDLTYRLHWATRNADLNGQTTPANLSLSIIMERHYAINWVTYYADEWDEVTTDT